MEGGGGISGRWGNPPVHIISHIKLIAFTRIGGVTYRMLPHLSGVPHLYVNKPVRLIQ